jgi:hypothetical protein
MGKFMWNVLFNRLKLTDEDIIAMTTVNFTGATDPNNITSVYKGVSAFTRCVWEIKLGNVVCSLQTFGLYQNEFHLTLKPGLVHR